MRCTSSPLCYVDSQPLMLIWTQCISDVEENFDSETTAVVIAGDFNAHLGTLAVPRGHGSPNDRELVLKEFIDRNK